jgi:hypothetical protein
VVTRPYDDFDPTTWPPPASWPAGNEQVFARDAGRCVIPALLADWRLPVLAPEWWRPCTRPAESTHHRVHGNRGDHRPAGRLSACGGGTTGHHGWIEAHPALAMQYGWTVTRYDTDPAGVPVWLAHPVWGLGWYLLDNAERPGLTPTEAPHAR